MITDTIQLFTDDLYKFITYNAPNCQCSAIIRKHSEMLQKNGDFSFPLQPKPWASHFKTGLKEERAIDVEQHFAKCCLELVEKSSKWHLKVAATKIALDRLNLFLCRKSALKEGIIKSLHNDKIMRSLLAVKSLKVTLDITDKINDSLSNFRVQLIGQVIENLSCLSENNPPHVVVTARSSFVDPGGSSIVLCGPVLNIKTLSKEIAISSEDYINKRQSEMTLIAQHKYGVRTSSDCHWRDLMRRTGDAAVRFELLQTRPGAAVKINFDHPAAGSSKGAAFVLYNCARLETLLRTFNEKMESTAYPQPPSVEDTNFDLLTDEDEWTLAFNYILGFPHMLQSCLRIDGDVFTISPHLLCNFLSSLARTFSQYYRRVRILTEPRAHLMPVLFARVCLLSALGRVLNTGLRLLGIDAVSHM